MSSNSCNCDKWQAQRESERECCECPVEKCGFYEPDTPTPEIDRKIQRQRDRAYECQKIWNNVKTASSRFDEPPPLIYPGTCPPPEPEPVIACEAEEKRDKAWCKKLNALIAPVPMVQKDCTGCNCETVPLSCPAIPPLTGASTATKGDSSTDTGKKQLKCSVVGDGEDESKPNPADCKKFMNYAKGLSRHNANKMELYDPRIKDKAKDNIKSCMYLGGSCFDAFDETVAKTETSAKKECNCNCQVKQEPSDTQRVKNVPEGCCDYRKAMGKTDKFIVPEEFDCPPFPDTEVDKLIMPPWFPCPAKSTVPPLQAPSGTKIKPISKGIRTNFERNPTCLCCGAKRKDPFKKKCNKDAVNKNCPAMKTRCPGVKPRTEKKDTSILGQVKSMIGIKW